MYRHFVAERIYYDNKRSIELYTKKSEDLELCDILKLIIYYGKLIADNDELFIIDKTDVSEKLYTIYENLKNNIPSINYNITQEDLDDYDNYISEIESEFDIIGEIGEEDINNHIIKLDILKKLGSNGISKEGNILFLEYLEKIVKIFNMDMDILIIKILKSIVIITIDFIDQIITVISEQTISLKKKCKNLWYISLYESNDINNYGEIPVITMFVTTQN